MLRKGLSQEQCKLMQRIEDKSKVEDRIRKLKTALDHLLEVQVRVDNPIYFRDEEIAKRVETKELEEEIVNTIKTLEEAEKQLDKIIMLYQEGLFDLDKSIEARIIYKLEEVK